MKQDCLDIGIIQAFLDGELDHGQSARVSGHIALCDVCTLMLADAEDESAVVFPALEREFATLVPTQRLWNKINESIETEKQSAPFWQKAWAFVILNLATPSFIAAAGMVVVFGLTAILIINRTSSTPEIAGVPEETVATFQQTTAQLSGPNPIETVVSDMRQAKPIAFQQVSYRSNERRVVGISTARGVSTASPDVANVYLPGEENYVKTISSLSRSVDSLKEDIFRPGERIAYERDMAVVDDAIAKMRVQINKDPKNDTAKQVLYSSYQNKIDLLNSVSQKEELVASLR